MAKLKLLAKESRALTALRDGTTEHDLPWSHWIELEGWGLVTCEASNGARTLSITSAGENAIAPNDPPAPTVGAKASR